MPHAPRDLRLLARHGPATRRLHDRGPAPDHRHRPCRDLERPRLPCRDPAGGGCWPHALRLQRDRAELSSACCVFSSRSAARSPGTYTSGWSGSGVGPLPMRITSSTRRASARAGCPPPRQTSVCAFQLTDLSMTRVGRPTRPSRPVVTSTVGRGAFCRVLAELRLEHRRCRARLDQDGADLVLAELRIVAGGGHGEGRSRRRSRPRSGPRRR